MIWTEATLLNSLYLGYQQLKMNNAVVPHVALGLAPGQSALASANETIRYIDALIIFKDKLWAVEIKISRSDLKRELANPVKSELWRTHTNSFYFLVPPNLVDHAKEVIPRQYGIMSVPGYTTSVGSPAYVMRNAKTVPEPLPLPRDTWRRMARKHATLAHEKRLAKLDIAQT